MAEASMQADTHQQYAACGVISWLALNCLSWPSPALQPCIQVYFQHQYFTHEPLYHPWWHDMTFGYQALIREWEGQVRQAQQLQQLLLSHYCCGAMCAWLWGRTALTGTCSLQL